MNIQLPRAVETYFAISNGADPSRLAACFCTDASVTDENRTHQGIDAIKAWKHETRQAFSYRVEPLDATQEGDRLDVVALVVGDFPGSPVKLKHAFSLDNDLIAALKIAP